MQISPQQSEVDLEGLVDALKQMGASVVQAEKVASEVSSGYGLSIRVKNSAHAQKLSIYWGCGSQIEDRT